MERIFSDFRYNKNIERKSIDFFLKELNERVGNKALLVLTTNGEDFLYDEWVVNRKSKFSLSYQSNFTKSKRLKSTILNMLVERLVVAAILVCETEQKYKDEIEIKEIWGYRLIKKTKKNIYFEKIKHEELYNYCTIDISSGKNIPPQEEVVYCGPEGKICGWDMI